MPVPVQVSLSADTLFVAHHHPVLAEQILQHLAAGVVHLLHHLGSFCTKALIYLKHQGTAWGKYSSRQRIPSPPPFLRNYLYK